MRGELKLQLQPKGKLQPEPFMTADEYNAFGEKFRKQVKPDLDKHREARIRSEEAAKRHLIG